MEGINTWRWKPERDAVSISLCSCLFPCLLWTVLYMFSLCKFHATAPLNRQMDTPNIEGIFLPEILQFSGTDLPEKTEIWKNLFLGIFNRYTETSYPDPCLGFLTVTLFMWVLALAMEKYPKPSQPITKSRTALLVMSIIILEASSSNSYNNACHCTYSWPRETSGLNVVFVKLLSVSSV